MFRVIRIKLKEVIEKSEYRDLSYRQLAKMMGISHHPLWKMISGGPYNPSLEMIDKLCDFFKCRPGDLLEYKKGK